MSETLTLWLPILIIVGWFLFFHRYRILRGLSRFVGGWFLPPDKPPPKQKKRPDRPKARPIPGFVVRCGAHLTTMRAVWEYFRDWFESELTLTIGGVSNWPAWKYLNKFIFIMGMPGTGKTSEMRAMMRSYAALFNNRKGRRARRNKLTGYRWFVIDPTSAYLAYLYQILPNDVEIIRLNPFDAYSRRWGLQVDLQGDPLIIKAFVAALFPAALRKAGNDPFWYLRAQVWVERVLLFFYERGGAFTLADVCRMFEYPQFFKPFLSQSPSTRGQLPELDDRLGQSILATAASRMSLMSEAASAMEYATGPAFTTLEFLNTDCVAHLEFTPDGMEALGLLASAMVEVKTQHGFKRNDEFNISLTWGDEGRFLPSFPFELINARGRGCGFGVILSSTGLPSLETGWTQDRTRELFDGAFTVISFTVGQESAEKVSKLIGTISGDQTSTGTNQGENQGTSVTYARESSSSESQGVTSGTSTNTAFTTRPLVTAAELTSLPQADPENDALHAVVFNRDVGTYVAKWPFLHAWKDLPPAPFDEIPRRPTWQKRLRPFSKADIDRLRIEMTPEVVIALTTVKDWSPT